MNKLGMLIAAVMLFLGVAGGYWYGQHQSPPDAALPESSAAADAEVLFYRHPMNPAITSPVPAKDSMNMDYIPVYADAETGPAGTVSIDPVTVQNIGVRSARAARRVIRHTVRAVGRVDYNEARLARLSPKSDGWVETQRVSNTGQSVRRGEVLLSLYSPQLVTAQQEYLLALENRAVLQGSPYAELRRNAESLVDVARGRLELLDMSADQIQELQARGKLMKAVSIHSPFNGVVMSVGARPGQYVMPGTELYQIADLSTVWVYVDVYENELPWVRVGSEAQMRIAAAPGRVFEAKVAYVYPIVDPKTRTARVRLEIDNQDGVLKPDMFAEVTLRPGMHYEAVAVPSEAIVRSGVRERVFVVRAPGKYEPREVRLGVSAEGWTEIKEGLSAGEEVLTSAQFLIDSESSLREAAGKMREQQAPSFLDDTGMPDKEGPMSGSMDLDMSDMQMSDLNPRAAETPPPGKRMPDAGRQGAHPHD